MLEELRKQISILERAAKDENAEVNMDEIKSVMFNASQRIETLENESKDQKAKVESLQPLAEVGTRKITETKEETLRLLTIVCEQSPTKDMGRRDRMKERFEKEVLDFEALSRYLSDVEAEYDVLFPESGRAAPKKLEEPTVTREIVDVSEFKISAKK